MFSARTWTLPPVLLAAGLVVEGGGGVRRQGGDVTVAVYQRGGDVRGVRVDGEAVVEGGLSGVVRGDEPGHTEAGGAVERDDADGKRRVRGIGKCRNAAQKRHAADQKKREESGFECRFHGKFLS